MTARAERIDVGRARLAGMRGPSAWARLAALRYLQLQRESLATCDDLPSVARLVVEAALELMPNVDGAVYEMVDGDEVLLAACSGSVAGFSGTRMPLKDSLSGGVLFSGKAVICDPLQNSCPATAAACRRFDIASLILVPTIIDRRVRGVLKLASHRPFAFTHDDLVTGELIASSLCIAHHAEDARVERETSAILHRRLHAMFEQASTGDCCGSTIVLPTSSAGTGARWSSSTSRTSRIRTICLATSQISGCCGAARLIAIRWRNATSEATGRSAGQG